MPEPLRTAEPIAAGGQPNPGTSPDRRLKANRKPAKKAAPKAKKAVKKAAPKMPMYPPKP